MTAIKLPHRYLPGFRHGAIAPNRYVEVDWSNPIVRGLCFAYFGENNKKHSLTAGAPLVDGGVSGPKGYTLSGAEVLAYERPAKFDTGHGTLIMAHTTNLVSQSSAKLFITTDGNIQVYRGPNTTVRFQRSSTEHLDLGINLFGSSNLGVENNLVFTWD